MLGGPQETGVRYYDGGDGAHFRDDLSCGVEPTHMRVAGGEIAIRHRVARVFLDRELQLRHRLVEAPGVEMRGADNKERRADAGARTEAQRGFDMLDRKCRVCPPIALGCR